MRKIRLALLADTHLTQDPSHPSNQNFIKVLDYLSTVKPNKLLLLGDIALERGTVPTYEWVADSLGKYSHSYWAIPGNHDAPELMETVFKSHAVISTCQKTLYGHGFLFLDSSKGFIPPDQLSLFRQLIQNSSHSGQLIFTHYPPTRTHSGFVDKNYALQNTTQVWNCLKKLPERSHIFSGHYHNPRTVCEGLLTLHACPSTSRQFSQFSDEFKIDHRLPGWRYVEWNGERLETTVHYCV